VKSQEQNSKENRKLSYSTVVLSYVAAIVALAALGTDIWSISGLPLILLWIGTLFLLFGGIFWIYSEYSGIKSLKIVSFLCIIAIILAYLAMGGNMGGQYWKTQPENFQILINLSCVDKMNCSVNIPAHIQISCQANTCPPQIQRLNETPLPIEIQYSKSNKCPPILSIPKI
jgi:hypothetical protein